MTLTLGKTTINLPKWSIIIPLVAWLSYALNYLNLGDFYSYVMGALLIGSVMAAVHHAEVVAHKVGEPLGTLILALAVTVIEAGLIISLMLAGGPDASTYARDTIFAAVMIILTGIVGICLLVGGFKFVEQQFVLRGVNTALVGLTVIVMLSMILPNLTVSEPGPYFNTSQLIFVGVVTLIIYLTFVLVQTVRHRDYFLPPIFESNKESKDAKDAKDAREANEKEREELGTAEIDNKEDTDSVNNNYEDHHADPPSNITAWSSAVLLLISLGVVIILGKALSPDIEAGVVQIGAPKSLVGVIIAGIVLLPEAIAAVRAARKNRLQTSLNLAFGSAMASVGLTIPTIAGASLVLDLPVTLGIDERSTVLVVMAIFINMLSLAHGRTNILQGVALLVLFATYLFTTIIP